MNRKNILLTVTVGLLTLCHTPLSHAQTAARLRIIATTDVHGNYFPHDFITGRDGDGSLSRIYKYVCSEREKYGANDVTPGITGWAQVTGFRGETRELWQMEGRVERDIWYIQHWSLWLDLRIIWLTFKTIFKRDKKAY